MRLCVTAGFDGSKPAIALCELLTRLGHDVHTVIVVTPYSFGRLNQLLLRRGVPGLWQAVKKMFLGGNVDGGSGPMTQFLLAESITFDSLKKWCQESGVKYQLVKSINSLPAISALNTCDPNATIYAGGGILRRAFIKAANGNIVNPHSGPLPEVRGMNAIEWTILLGYEPSITVHLIDDGIDTGKILSKVALPLKTDDSVTDIRERAIVAGIKEIVSIFNGLCDLDDVVRYENLGGAGRQSYVMSTVIGELLEYKLKQKSAT